MRLVYESDMPMTTGGRWTIVLDESVSMRVDDAEGAIAFASSDPSIVGVEPSSDAGAPFRAPRCRLLARAVGETVITASSEDASATIVVEVIASLRDIGFDWY